MCTTQLQVSEETNRKCQAYWSWVRNNSECPFVFWETHSCHLQKQQALLSVTLSECFFFLFFKLHLCYGAGGCVCLAPGGSQKKTLWSAFSPSIFMWVPGMQACVAVSVHPCSRSILSAGLLYCADFLKILKSYLY